MSVSFRFQSESFSDQTDPFPAVDLLGEKDLGAQNCMNLRSVRDLEHLKIRTVEHRLQQFALRRLLCKIPELQKLERSTTSDLKICNTQYIKNIRGSRIAKTYKIHKQPKR